MVYKKSRKISHQNHRSPSYAMRYTVSIKYRLYMYIRFLIIVGLLCGIVFEVLWYQKIQKDNNVLIMQYNDLYAEQTNLFNNRHQLLREKLDFKKEKQQFIVQKVHLEEEKIQLEHEKTQFQNTTYRHYINRFIDLYQQPFIDYRLPDIQYTDLKEVQRLFKSNIKKYIKHNSNSTFGGEFLRYVFVFKTDVQLEYLCQKPQELCTLDKRMLPMDQELYRYKYHIYYHMPRVEVEILFPRESIASKFQNITHGSIYSLYHEGNEIRFYFNDNELLEYIQMGRRL